MPFNRLSVQKRALILSALFEGAAINSVCRMFKVGKHAVLRVICETGEACEDYHNRHFRGLKVQRLELDEQWAYVHTHKERMTKEEKHQHPDRGDCWLWASIDPDSKAIVNWLTGKRTARAAQTFADDLATRVDGQVQITTDPHNGYAYAIPSAFAGRLDYAHEQKTFASSKVPAHEWPKYKVDPLVGVERKAVVGNPNLKTATACHIERFFLTVRQSNKRCARKTLAYSKLWENHALTASLVIFVYNMVRKHETTKQTPAVMLGVADRRWTLEDVVAMTDEYLAGQELKRFEDAFKSKFNERPLSMRTYEPQAPRTPWHLDPESGGPNPPMDERKPGIAYEDDL